MGAVDIRKINVHRIGRWSGVLGDILSVTAGYALTAAFCGLTFMADATIYLIFLSSTLLFSELLNSYDDGFSYLTQKQRLPITVGITFVLSVCTASLINLFVSAFMLLPVWCYITFFVLSYTFLLCVRFALLEALIRIRRAQSLLILYYPGCPDKFLNKLRKNAEEIGTVEFYMLSPDEEDGVEQRIDACDRVLLLENIPGDVCDKYILYSLQKQKNIQVIPTVENLSFLGGQIKHIGDTPVISLKNAHLMLFERIVKRGFDFVGALAGLIILSPVFAAIAIAIKLDTPGPVFYKQERYTINKKRFDIIKFRTMVEDAESMGVRLATENDDRITKVGHFLRACRIDFSDLKDAADGKITYGKDSRRKNATIDTGDYAVLYNGKAAKSKTPADFVGKSNGRLELTDNDGDGRYEVISIFEYRVTVVSTASKTDKIITDQNADSVLRLSASDIVCNIYENGSASDFDAITEGKFLISYLSEDGLLCNIYVYSDTVEAAVAGVDKADKKIILDETEYDYDEYFEMYYLEQLVLGQKSEFYVADGRIYACVLDRSTEMLYGYIVRVRKFDGENGETVRFKIFNEDGKLDNYDAAEKVKIDDKMRKESDVIYGYFTSEGVTNRQLVRYKLNKDGEISVIDTCNSAGRLDSSAKDTNNLTRYKFPRAVATSLWYIDTNKSFHPYFRIADDTKIFMVADGKVADEKRCAIKDADYFKANRSQKSAALNIYNLTELGVAGAIVIVDSSAITPTVADDAPVGIVYRVAKTIDSDDNLTYRFSIFRDGEFSHFFVAEDAIERIAPGGICKADKGDAVRYSLDNDGNINALEKDYDASEDAITKPFPDNGTGTHTSKGVNYFGMVYDVSGTDITIVPQGVPGIAYDPQDKDSRFSMGLASCKIYVVSEDCERIYEGSANDIMTYRNSGSSCDRVLISVNDGVAQSVIVYK